jgi:hypothetical protein
MTKNNSEHTEKQGKHKNDRGRNRNRLPRKMSSIFLAVNTEEEKYVM